MLCSNYRNAEVLDLVHKAAMVRDSDVLELMQHLLAVKLQGVSRREVRITRTD